MKPLSGLFKPIPFLLKYQLLHQKYFPNEAYTLQLRPFSIMEDISTVYSWINKPRLLCSGHVKPYQRNMLSYYKNILDSSDSQTFMVLQDSVPVFQVDILQAALDPLHTKRAKSIQDVSFRYLADPRIGPSAFSNSVRLCMEYLFSFSGNPTVFTELLSSGLVTTDELTSIGFKYLDEYARDDKVVKLFSCAKEEFKNS
jgi:hypothetical protein